MISLLFWTLISKIASGRHLDRFGGYRLLLRSEERIERHHRHARKEIADALERRLQLHDGALKKLDPFALGRERENGHRAIVLPKPKGMIRSKNRDKEP